MSEWTQDRAWKPEPVCCWCGSGFRQEDIQGMLAWVCEKTECRERQLVWLSLDDNGQFFYLPTPKQTVLEEAVHAAVNRRAPYRQICIGGDRGGAKSTALRNIAYRYCRKMQVFKTLFLRRTYIELMDNHIRDAQATELERIGGKYANYVVSFADTKSSLQFGHCQDAKDFSKYVGPEYDLIIFDQLEQFTQQQYSEICAATGRKRRQGWRGVVVAGENPGGPLSAFVDELFISKTRDRVKYPGYKPEHYHFIPAQLEDNPWIDSDYEDFLAGLEPVKRDMYRFGRRDRYPGQFFGSFDRDLHVKARVA